MRNSDIEGRQSTWDIIAGLGVGAVIAGLLARAPFLAIAGLMAFAYGLYLMRQETPADLPLDGVIRCRECWQYHHYTALVDGKCRKCRRRRRARKEAA